MPEVTSGAATKKPPERKAPPRVNARHMGTVNAIIDAYIIRLKAEFPDKHFRLVFAPAQGSQYAQVQKRMAMGYQIVDSEGMDLNQFSPHEGSEVRVGDTIVMMIDKDLHEEEVAFREITALDEAMRSQKVYEDFMQQQGDRTEGKIKSSGKITRTHEYREIPKHARREEE